MLDITGLTVGQFQLIWLFTLFCSVLFALTAIHNRLHVSDCTLEPKQSTINSWFQPCQVWASPSVGLRGLPWPMSSVASRLSYMYGALSLGSCVLTDLAGQRQLQRWREAEQKAMADPHPLAQQGRRGVRPPHGRGTEGSGGICVFFFKCLLQHIGLLTTLSCTPITFQCLINIIWIAYIRFIHKSFIHTIIPIVIKLNSLFINF